MTEGSKPLQSGDDYAMRTRDGILQYVSFSYIDV